MPAEFEAFLERMDFDFTQFGTHDEFLEYLGGILGRTPAGEQITVAQGLAQQQFRQVIFETIDRGMLFGTFRRQEQTVHQLRDARGRFVAAGLPAIQRHFDANPVGF